MRKWIGLRHPLLWSVLLLLCSGLARAQEPHAEPFEGELDGYRETITDAVREYKLRNYAEARSLFARAHELAPSARTLRGLGACEFELRNYVDSVRLLEQALTSKVKPLEGELRARTERLLARSRGFVGRVQLALTPGRGVLGIDGMDTPTTSELLLAVGDHVLEYRAPEHVAERKRLRIDGGESALVTFALAPLAAQRELGQRSDHTPARRRWLWAAAGVVLAGAAVATAVSLTREDHVAAADPGTSNRTLP
jgi:tetratricopeptide (TPR) repeat protein